MLGLIGKKLGMTRIFNAEGVAMTVTVIEAGPCLVTQVKTDKRDGYNALQLGFGQKKEKRVSKPLKGHLKRLSGSFPRFLREFRVDDVSKYEPGQALTVGIFNSGEGVNVIGTTKGRGFQGVVKRYGCSGGDEAHGCALFRAPGSVGASADPSKTWKNVKMAGQYGNTRQTMLNLRVVKVDAERNYLFLRGAVPGPTDGMVIVSKKKG
jgi:large subunit ribosomal protein L3